MRLRSARRLSRYLFTTGKISRDYFYEIQYRKIELRFTGRYVACFPHKGLLYRRASYCAWRLVLAVYKVLSGDIERLQGRDMSTGRIQDTVYDAVKRRIKFPLVSSVNVPLSSSDMRRVKAAVEVKPLIEGLSTSGFVHSSNVVDPELVAGGYSSLAEKPTVPLDLEVLWLMFVRTAVYLPEDDKGNIRVDDLHITAKEMADLSCTDVSAGYVPTTGRDCDKVGSKKDKKYAAIALNVRDGFASGLPGNIPHRPFLKPEVIKVGKKVRGIQVQSIADWMVCSLSMRGGYGCIGAGDAQCVSITGGGYREIFISWYYNYRHYTGGSWSDFLDWLSDVGLNESDKKSWEASTNETDCLDYVISEFLTINDVDLFSSRLYLRSIVGYMNPFISLGRVGFYAPFRVASGTRRTTAGNTRRHLKMVLWVSDYIDIHSYRLGDPDCGCGVCERVKDQSWFGDTVSELEMAFLRMPVVLGDDYMCPAVVPHALGFIMDLVFGTETVTEVLPPFADPGGRSAEFLRRRCRRQGEEITFYRDSARLEAKLALGNCTESLPRFCSALISYRLEAGDNPELQEKLEDIHRRLPKFDLDQYTKELGRCSKQAQDHNPPLKFTYNDVVNADLTVARPVLYHMRNEATFRQYRVGSAQFFA